MKKTINYAVSGVVIITLLAIGACSKKHDALPAINGYNSSNDVAKDNLIAHWTFDGTNNETISSTAPTSHTGDTFADGVKGQALMLDAGYINYPTIPALSSADAFPSVTVSAWVNLDNNGSKATSIFAITESIADQSDWNSGPVNFYAETGHPVAYDDTLVLHASFSTYDGDTRRGGDNINDYGIRGTDFQTVHGTNKWVHYIMTYDGTGSNIDLYADGVKVSNNQFRYRHYNNGTAEVGIGVIKIKAPTQVVIGAWPNNDSGFTNSPVQDWQGLMTGGVDELRVYSKVLTEVEIGSLYQLELAAR